MSIIERILAHLGFFRRKVYAKLTEEAIEEIIDLYRRIPLHCSYSGFVHPKYADEGAALTTVAARMCLRDDGNAFKYGDVFSMCFFKKEGE